MNCNSEKTYFFIVILSIIAGGISGYIGSSFSSVPGQIAIVDIQEMVRKSSSNGSHTDQDAKVMTAKVKEITDSLVEQGIVVFDSKYILRAPEEAYVTVD